MMFPIAGIGLLRGCLSTASRAIPTILARSFHSLLARPSISSITQSPGQLLACPGSPLVNLVNGFKVKGRLKRRCKDCYFVWRQQRLYVMCKTHPRHKQMSMVKKEWNTWILTHASQGKVREW
ncbi:large ribosomal subunit protein bL36m [Phlebotomus argentipes]|uniref:large ribosomal subunit protein bL36m n=1 Tax=Phlebotomus argentipes TaxID=94469 RepID=UPI00289349CE|nr:large ribosomal subunit protein bL36m [Phlebotomus argentipes]